MGVIRQTKSIEGEALRSSKRSLNDKCWQNLKFKKPQVNAQLKLNYRKTCHFK